MKRLCKIVIPCILMPSLVWLMRGGKDILDGLYIVFPLMYVVMGLVCKSPLSELLPVMFLTSLAFLVPINLWFHMGTCVELVFVYLFLGCIAYAVKRGLFGIRRRKKEKSSAREQDNEAC